MITATATLTETISVTASLGGSVCLAATYTLVDTDTPPNTLDSGSIASGAAATIVAPAATVTVNTAPFGTAPSGGALNVPVVSEDLTNAGTIIAGKVVIANTDVTINTAPVDSLQAEDLYALTITLDGAAPATPVTYNSGTKTANVTSAPCTGNWIRPSDWIAIPTLTAADERIYAVVVVFENEYNSISVTITAATSNINWGDGTSVVSNGFVQSKVYDYVSLAGSINVWPDGRNYKQVLLDITRVGAAITSVNFTAFSSVARDSNTNFVDMSISLPSCTALQLSVNPIASAGRRLIYIERLRIYSLAAGYGGTTNFMNFIHSLQVLELPWGRFGNVSGMMNGIGAIIDEPTTIVTTATNLDNAFRGFVNLPDVTANSCTSMIGGFAYDKLKSIGTVTATALTNGNAAFQATYNLTGEVVLDMPLLQNATNMFNASAVRSVVFSNCAAMTTTTGIFSLASNLQNAVMPNLTRGVTFANTPMGNMGMSNFANSIGTASGAQTITVTGTPYGQLLTALDATALAIRLVMTGKGYTVAN